MKTTSWHVLRGRSLFAVKRAQARRNPYSCSNNRGETRASAAHLDAVCCWYRPVHAARLLRLAPHPPWQLADDNLAKAQAAGLQLNRRSSLEKGVLHRTADAKVPELHEANARLTNLLISGEQCRQLRLRRRSSLR